MNRVIGISHDKSASIPHGMDAVQTSGLVAYFMRGDQGTKLSHHQDVIRLCGAASAVLPARFLDVRSQTDLDDALRTHAHAFDAALAAAYGKIEIAFSAQVTKPAVDANRQRPGTGKSFLRERARDLHIASTDARILDRLKAHLADAHFPGLCVQAACDKGGFSGSILVARSHGPKVAAKIETILKAQDAVENFKLLGPLPPYSFLSVSSILDGSACREGKA